MIFKIPPNPDFSLILRFLSWTVKFLLLWCKCKWNGCFKKIFPKVSFSFFFFAFVLAFFQKWTKSPSQCQPLVGLTLQSDDKLCCQRSSQVLQLICEYISSALHTLIHSIYPILSPKDTAPFLIWWDQETTSPSGRNGEGERWTILHSTARSSHSPRVVYYGYYYKYVISPKYNLTTTWTLLNWNA